MSRNGNPRRRPTFPEGYRGDSARLEYLIDVMCWIYHMSLDLTGTDAEFRTRLAAVNDLAARTIIAVGDSRHLHFNRIHVPEYIIDSGRVHVTHRDSNQGQHGDGGLRLRSTDDDVHGHDYDDSDGDSGHGDSGHGDSGGDGGHGDNGGDGGHGGHGDNGGDGGHGDVDGDASGDVTPSQFFTPSHYEASSSTPIFTHLQHEQDTDMQDTAEAETQAGASI